MASWTRCFPDVLMLFLHGGFVVGTVKAMGVFFEDISVSLGTTSTDIGVILGLFYASSLVPAPLLALLYRRFPHRRISQITGAIMASLGVMLVSIASSNVQVAVFLVISGIGQCTVRVFSACSLNEKTGQDFNLLLSLAFTGAAAGMFLISLLAATLVGPFGWRGGMLIIGALYGIIIPCAIKASRPDRSKLPSATSKLKSEIGAKDNSLLKEDETEQDTGYRSTTEYGSTRCKKESKSQEESALLLGSPEEYERSSHSETSSSVEKSDIRHCNFCERLGELFRESEFYLDPCITFVMLASFAHFTTYSGWHDFLIPHALQRGLSLERIVFITLCASIGNLIGRVLTGFITHRLMRPINLFLIMTFLNVGLLLCYVFTRSFVAMLVLSFLSAWAILGRNVTPIMILRERALPDNFPIMFALYDFVSGCGILFGGYLSGMIADRFSSYEATFIFLAGTDLLAFLLMIPPRLVKKSNYTIDN